MEIHVCFTKLDAALQEVKRSHRKRQEVVPAPPENLLMEVRRKIRQCPEEHLASLAFSLTVEELAAAISLPAIDGDDPALVGKCYKIQQYRPLEEVFWAGVSCVLQRYPAKALQRVLGRLLQKKVLFPQSVPETFPKPILSWLVALTGIGSAALSEYENRVMTEKETLPFFLKRARCEWENVNTHVWHLLLLKGNKRAMACQELPDLYGTLVKGEGLAAIHQKRMQQHYLIALESVAFWHDKILYHLMKTYGIPEIQSETRSFWKEIPEPVRQNFRHWCIGQAIEDFFDGERAEFWKRFYQSQDILDVKTILKGDGFMLRFRHFGVVEFKEIGNAAYVYGSEVFETFWKAAGLKDTPEAFKDIGNTLRYGHGKDGRIIHRQDWEERVYGEIRQFIDRMNRASNRSD